MKILMSPAKIIELTNHPKVDKQYPYYNDYSKKVWENIENMDIFELMSFFDISEKIANNIYNVIKNNKFGLAFYSYNGLTYKQLNSRNKIENIDFINNNFFILDTLFGILKPNDLIWEYRLDYQIKDKQLVKALKQHWITIYRDFFINDYEYIALCSNEFKKLLQTANVKYYNVLFLSKNKAGKLVENATLCKIQRGKLADYIIENNNTSPSFIKTFESEFKFNNALSSEYELIFTKT